MKTQIYFHPICQFSLKTILTASIAFSSTQVFAQLPESNSNIIYMVSGTYIYNYNPSQPILPGINPTTNKIPLPDGSKSCLAVCKNPKMDDGSLTFFTVVNDSYYYYHDGVWQSTGHSTGHQSAANIGSAGNYIYNLVSNGGQIYVYNGKENGKLLTKVNFAPGGPVDVIGDNDGNFYVLKTSPPQVMSVYNIKGDLTHTYNLTGMPNISNGGGFAIVDQKIYVSNTNGFYVGEINGCIIEFINTRNPLPFMSIQDYGSSSFEPLAAVALKSKIVTESNDAQKITEASVNLEKNTTAETPKEIISASTLKE